MSFHSLHQWKATLSYEETPAAGAQVVCEALFAQRQSKSHVLLPHLYEWWHCQGMMS